MDVLQRKLEDTLTCSVCQEIFKDPWQLPCGHSFCLSCLENLGEHSNTIPSRCPNCRKDFRPLDRISKSFTLTNIAEEYQEFRRKENGPDRNVYCDCCPGNENQAVKTCVRCEVSLCSEHIRHHLERPAFADHRLVEPLMEIKKRKCAVHAEVTRHYCRESRSYVCNLCTMESKWEKKTQAVMFIIKTQLLEHLRQVDLRFEMLKHQVRESSQSIRSLQEDIQSQRKTTEQNVYPPESPANSITIVLFCLFLTLVVYAYNCSVENQALTEAQKDQQTRIHHIYAVIAKHLVDDPLSRHLPPVTKDEGALMLDLETANEYIEISNDLRTAKKVRTRMGYPRVPTRFHDAPQVLSAHCVRTGAHVWEVEAEGYWDVAVSFRRTEDESRSRSTFGNNPHSWSLTHDGRGKLVAYHDGRKSAVSAALGSNRLAVMVDIEKGNITFASLGSTVERLHEFRAKLTQPVCLGFGLYRLDPPSVATIVKVW